MTRKLFVMLTVLAGLAVAPSAAAAETTDVYGWSASKTFYPFVVDGYRDVYKAAVDFSPPSASWTCDTGTYRARVINSSGTAVRTYAGTVDLDNYPTRIIAWAGRRSDGSFVARGGYFSLAVTTSATCYDELDEPFSVNQSDTMTGIHPVTGYKLVRRTRTTDGYVGSRYTSGPCPQRRWNLAWQVNCLHHSSRGVATFRHTFPRNAVAGTRQLARGPYIIWWLPGWYMPPKLRNQRMVGRTYYVDVKVAPHTKVRVKRITWAWKVKVRI